jgi:hypothetical protein
LEHVQIHDTSNGRLHGEEGAVHSSFAEGAIHVHLWAVTNMFQEDTWIFTSPDPADVDIDFTTDMKRVLFSENYGVWKSLIALYQMKHLHNHNYTRQNSLLFVHFESLKLCTYPLNKFIQAFKVVKLFLKHSLL